MLLHVARILSKYIPAMNNSLSLYRELYNDLYLDIAERCSVPQKVVAIELEVIQHRFEREGLSFLTKTLPAVGKALDRTLATGSPYHVPHFCKEVEATVPKFLGWLLKWILRPDGKPRLSFTSDGEVEVDLLEFPISNEELLNKATPSDLGTLIGDYVRMYRQLCFFLYRLKLPHGQEDEDRVIRDFLDTEDQLSQLVLQSNDPIIRRARAVTTRVFGSFDPAEIIPRHGPGSVSTGEDTTEKTIFKRIYSKLDTRYPFTAYFMLPTQVADECDWLQTLEVLDTATAKVVMVPKDSRGPRLISCEPLELMWIQQGLGAKIVRHLEQHRLTQDHVNFTRQSINRTLALVGSLTNEWVTLDMKDASDRVSLELVKELFAGTTLLESLLATRSDQTMLPSGDIVALKKFAPMGSSLCFPVESFVFYALCVGTLMVHGYTQRQAIASVYVYGDDIIVKREVYPLILQHLPRFGLKFNPDKCCTAPHGFRESCGMDAFFGVCASPLRLKTVWNRRRPKDATELASYVGFCNQAESEGYERLSCTLRKLITKRYGVIPYTEDENPSFIGFYTKSIQPKKANKELGVRYRFNSELHREEILALSVRPVTVKVAEQGWKSLLRHIFEKRAIHGHCIYALTRRSCLKRVWGPWNG